MTQDILIIGATGVFGSRLAERLAETGGFRLLLASRSLDRATRFADTLSKSTGTGAALVPIALDVAGDLAAALKQHRPAIVVDCSGPFQSADYSVPLAALEAGAHFVDLADARGYLLGFTAALDAAFRAKDRVALAGASSSPALSAAAVAALTRGWTRIDSIDIAIVPGGRSEVGEAAVGGALSYCGREVPVIAAGRPGRAIGWGEVSHIDMAGLGRRRVSPVETADAGLLSRLHPTASSIRFRAGLESRIEHWGMRALAGLVRSGLLRRPERLAGLLQRARRLTRLTTGSSGGMRVSVTGLDAQGRWTQAEWRLIARDNDGPHVPPAPAAAAVRAILAGREPAGARPALELPLDAIEAELAGRAITTAREVTRAKASLFEQAIGPEAFAALPDTVRAFHDLDAPAVWSGRANIEGAASLPARLVALAFAMPSTASDVPLTVAVERRLSESAEVPDETWTRCFASASFRSNLSSPAPGVAFEHFAPFDFRIGLALSGSDLVYPVAGWRIGPLPLPLALAPRSVAREWQDDTGRFNFDVHLSLPIVGLLAHYRGWLLPRPAADAEGERRCSGLSRQADA